MASSELESHRIVLADPIELNDIEEQDKTAEELFTFDNIKNSQVKDSIEHSMNIVDALAEEENPIEELNLSR